MNKMYKMLILSILFLPIISFAQENSQIPAVDIVVPSSNAGDNTGGRFEIIADVNIFNARIINFSEKERRCDLAFEISNGEGVQPQIKYIVRVYEIDESGNRTLVDNKKYDEVVSIGKNEKIDKTISYNIPKAVGGKLELHILAANEKGLEFGGNVFGEVEIKKAEGILIDSSKCYLLIGSAEKKYNIFQGVDISSEEILKVRCDGIMSNFNENLDFKAKFKTRERTAFGKVVKEAEFDNNSIDAGEKKSLSFVLDVDKLKPQSYQVEIGFYDDKDNIISNVLEVRYVIQGESATIQNVNLDKDYYKKGETAKIKVVVSGTASVFPGARGADPILMGEIHQNDIAFEVGIFDGENNCSKLIRQKTSGRELVINLEAPIVRDCLNPVIKIVAKDVDGNILDKNDFKVETRTDIKELNKEHIVWKLSYQKTLFWSVFLVVGGILLVIGIKLFKPKRNVIVKSVVLFIFFGGLLGSQQAEATSFSHRTTTKIGTPAVLMGWYQTDDDSYACGEDVFAIATAKMRACANMYPNMIVDIIFGSDNKKRMIDYTGKSYGKDNHEYHTFMAEENNNGGDYRMNLGKYKNDKTIKFGFLFRRFYPENYYGKGNICSLCDAVNGVAANKYSCPCHETYGWFEKEWSFKVASCPACGSSGVASSGEPKALDTTTPPTTGLCASGEASGVSGSGYESNPWTWTCGGTVTCQAYYREQLLPPTCTAEFSPGEVIVPGAASLNVYSKAGVENIECQGSAIGITLNQRHKDFTANDLGTGTCTATVEDDLGGEATCSAEIEVKNEAGECAIRPVNGFSSIDNACVKGSFNSVHLVEDVLKWRCGTGNSTNKRVGSFADNNPNAGDSVASDHSDQTDPECECTPNYKTECIPLDINCENKCGQFVTQGYRALKSDTRCFPNNPPTLDNNPDACSSKQVKCPACGAADSSEGSIYQETN
jgi:hypothetical protein